MVDRSQCPQWVNMEIQKPIIINARGYTPKYSGWLGHSWFQDKPGFHHYDLVESRRVLWAAIEVCEGME